MFSGTYTSDVIDPDGNVLPGNGDLVLPLPAASR